MADLHKMIRQAQQTQQEKQTAEEQREQRKQEEQQQKAINYLQSLIQEALPDLAEHMQYHYDSAAYAAMVIDGHEFHFWYGYARQNDPWGDRRNDRQNLHCAISFAHPYDEAEGDFRRANQWAITNPLDQSIQTTTPKGPVQELVLVWIGDVLDEIKDFLTSTQQAPDSTDTPASQ